MFHFKYGLVSAVTEQNISQIIISVKYIESDMNYPVIRSHMGFLLFCPSYAVSGWGGVQIHNSII